MAYSIELEARKNFDYFQTAVAIWMQGHAGEYALLRAGKLIDFFDKAYDAAANGVERFEDGLFSVQKVTDRPVDLGFLSYGSGDRTAD